MRTPASRADLSGTVAECAVPATSDPLAESRPLDDVRTDAPDVPDEPADHVLGDALMPAKSQAQRAFLNAKFGHAWVKKHHFDNPGKLPEHVKKHAGKQAIRNLGK